MSTSGAAETAAAGVAALAAPAAATAAARSESLRFHTVSSCPRSSSTARQRAPHRAQPEHAHLRHVALPASSDRQPAATVADGLLERRQALVQLARA